MSFFISFEGGEGTGKSTQSELLARRLSEAAFDVRFIHEPGSTHLGWYIRDWLKRGVRLEHTISNNAELFLFSAARSELVTKSILPARHQQNVVFIADRYVDSTTAYQGYGRGIPLNAVEAINLLATQGVMPDLTFLLDCAPEVGLGRVGSFQMRLPLHPAPAAEYRDRDEEGTRFEEESIEFHQRVREGYQGLAQQEPKRWCVIDATKPFERIHDLVWQRVASKLRCLGYEFHENLTLPDMGITDDT